MSESQSHLEHPTPKPELDPSFVSKMFDLCSMLERPAPEDRVRTFGPHYRVLKDGRELDCYTVRTDIAKTGEHKIDIVAAATPQQMPVAHSHVHWRRREGKLVAENEIMTGVRGAGFALPPLLVFFDLMQREANRLNEPIIIEETDQNLKSLRYFKDLLKADASISMIAQYEREIERLQSERERWLTLFGVHGRLGYDSNLRKYIKPQEQDVRRSDRAQDITLEARLEQGMPVVVEETALASGNMTFQTARRQELLNILHHAIKKS